MSAHFDTMEQQDARVVLQNLSKQCIDTMRTGEASQTQSCKQCCGTQPYCVGYVQDTGILNYAAAWLSGLCGHGNATRDSHISLFWNEDGTTERVVELLSVALEAARLYHTQRNSDHAGCSGAQCGNSISCPAGIGGTSTALGHCC